MSDRKPYIDAFVCAVPTAKKEDYIVLSEKMGEIAKDCGALASYDCWGDEVPEGEVTSFPLAVQKKEDETVTFGWIMWPNKQARDSGMQAMRQDKRMSHEDFASVLDGKRLIMGGFQPIAGGDYRD